MENGEERESGFDIQEIVETLESNKLRNESYQSEVNMFIIKEKMHAQENQEPVMNLKANKSRDPV